MRGALFERLMGRDAAKGQLAPGFVVGRFRIIRLIARSASASMYLATRCDCLTEAAVAIRIVDRVECSRDSDGRLNRLATVLDSGKLEDGREWMAIAIAW